MPLPCPVDNARLEELVAVHGTPLQIYDEVRLPPSPPPPTQRHCRVHDHQPIMMPSAARGFLERLVPAALAGDGA